MKVTNGQHLPADMVIVSSRSDSMCMSVHMCVFLCELSLSLVIIICSLHVLILFLCVILCLKVATITLICCLLVLLKNTMMNNSLAYMFDR